MVEDLQRQYGVIPPIQPTYQISPQHFISNSHPSHAHYSSTFDKGNTPHYPSTTYNSIHNPHNSSNTNALAKEMEQLKNYLLTSQLKESTFHAMCPLPTCFEDHSPHVPSNPNPPCNSTYFAPNVKNHCLNPLPIVTPWHNPNPPKTSFLPHNRFFSHEFLSKYNIHNEVSQSPKVLPQDLPPQHDIMDFSSPLDLSFYPSHHFLIP